MSTQYLPLQFRAFPDIEYQRAKHPKVRRAMSGRHVLIDDTETTTDHTQRLLFGSGRLLIDRWDGSTLTCDHVETILYFAEDLPKIRPLTFSALQKIARERNIKLIPHEQYVSEYLLRCGYPDVTSPDYDEGTLIFYNASFDIFRHGSRVTEPRGEMFRNGLGAEFLSGADWAPYYRESRAGIGMRRELTRREAGFKVWHPPAIVDLAELVRALTGKPHTLLSAGKAFRCDALKYDAPEIHDPEVNYTGRDQRAQIKHYIEYNLQDVTATAELYARVLTRFYRHPLRLRPELCFSPAAIAKQYLRDMGIHAPLCTCEDCKPLCTCKTSCSRCEGCTAKNRCACLACRRTCACDVHSRGAARRGAWGVDPRIMGIFAAAFLGARAEAGIRLMSTPGILYDWKSMYPTIMYLLGIWELVTAHSINVREETADVQKFLDEVKLDDLLKPETWPQMRGVAELYADNDLIPVRVGLESLSGGAQSSAIATKYVSQEPGYPPLSLSILDLVASKIRSGKTPKILRAYRVYPVGRQSTLKPINFAGRVKFDPGRDNWFKFLVDQREAIKLNGDPYDEELGYKLTNNSNYGVFAEMNLSERKSTVYGIGGESWDVPKAEKPGEFSCPLFAALITGGARLMLAMFQSLAGPHIFCDTDSYCAPSTPDGFKPDGCEVDVLSWDQVQAIAERFDSLNPYNPDLVPHLIEWQQPAEQADGTREPVLVTAISAKRYAMYRMRNGLPDILSVKDGGDSEDSDMDIVKRSEHGLGLYLSPYAHEAALSDDADEAKKLRKRFYDEVWAYGIQKYVLHKNVPAPAWFDLPAVSRYPVRTRHTWKAFAAINSGKPYHEQIIPGNFYLAIHRPRSGLMFDVGTGYENMRLIAPFTADTSRWMDLEWFDVNTGQRYGVTTDPDLETDRVLLVKTYRDVIHEYFTHPERKYDGPDGKPCGMFTRGILQPGTVIPESYSHITKDSSSVTTAVEAFEHRGPYVYSTDATARQIELIRKFLRAKCIGRVNLERMCGVSKKVAERFLSDKATLPTEDNFYKVLRPVRKLAVEELRGAGYYRNTLNTPSKILREWLGLVEAGLMIPLKYEIPSLPPSLIDLEVEFIGPEE